MTSGCEWVVDAGGCDPAALSSLDALEALFHDLVESLHLHPIAAATWHRFPGPGGVTGLLPLAESHLAVHTFPEHGTLCLNLFCCRPRPRWDFTTELQRRFAAVTVEIRTLERATLGAPERQTP